ncbi:MAG: hypothetical protein QXY40_04805 [Candidatus Methanomethylicia archaeon]
MKAMFIIAISLLFIFSLVFSFTSCSAEAVVTRSNLIDWDGSLFWFNVTFPDEWAVKHNYTVDFSFKLVTLKGNAALRLIRLHAYIPGTEISNSTPIMRELRIDDVYTVSLSFWAKDFSFSSIPAGSSKLYKINIDLYGEIDKVVKDVKYTYPKSSSFSFNLQIRSPAAPVILSHNAPSSVDVNAPFDIGLTLLNGGEYFIRNIKIQALPPSGLQLRSVDVFEVKSMSVNESKVFTFRFIALNPGLHSVKFTVSYISYGDYEVKRDLTVQVRAKSLSSITCSYSPKTPTVFTPVNITGSINPNRQSEISVLVINPMNMNKTFTAKTDSKGMFSTAFTPDVIGTWRIVVSWPGDSEYSSSQTSFSIDVGKGVLNVVLSINPENPRIDSDVTVSGRLSIPVDVTLSLLITSPTGSSSRFNVQASRGSFTYTFRVNEAGTWVVDVSWPGNESFQGFRRVQTFEVHTPERGFLFGLSLAQLIIIASVVIVFIVVLLIVFRRR